MLEDKFIMGEERMNLIAKVSLIFCYLSEKFNNEKIWMPRRDKAMMSTVLE